MKIIISRFFFFFNFKVLKSMLYVAHKLNLYKLVYWKVFMQNWQNKQTNNSKTKDPE